MADGALALNQGTIYPALLRLQQSQESPAIRPHLCHAVRTAGNGFIHWPARGKNESSCSVSVRALDEGVRDADQCGAWGCGAFGNDPRRTARDFRRALEDELAGAFSDVVFAITDWSPERRYLGPFRDVFAGT